MVIVMLIFLLFYKLCGFLFCGLQEVGLQCCVWTAFRPPVVRVSI